MSTPCLHATMITATQITMLDHKIATVFLKSGREFGLFSNWYYNIHPHTHFFDSLVDPCRVQTFSRDRIQLALLEALASKWGICLNRSTESLTMYQHDWNTSFTYWIAAVSTAFLHASQFWETLFQRSSGSEHSCFLQMQLCLSRGRTQWKDESLKQTAEYYTSSATHTRKWTHHIWDLGSDCSGICAKIDLLLITAPPQFWIMSWARPSPSYKFDCDAIKHTICKWPKGQKCSWGLV